MRVPSALSLAVKRIFRSAELCREQGMRAGNEISVSMTIHRTMMLCKRPDLPAAMLVIYSNVVRAM
jgi:hypothetical protein